MTFKPYPEARVEDGMTPGIFTIRTAREVIAHGTFKSRDHAQRLADCWNACREVYAPDSHITAQAEYVKRLELLRKEAWERAMQVDGGWSQDISAAPRGKTVQQTRMVAKKVDGAKVSVPVTMDVPDVDPIIVETKCGKVIRSYWIEKEKRWAGLANGEAPVAWMPWPSPSGAHPTPAKEAAE